MSTIQSWSRLSQQVLASSRIMKFCRADDQSPYTQQTHEFVFLESADWVNIIPITLANEVVMVKQFRHGDQSISLEIPGGMIDADEAADIAACRECWEETGYRPTALVSMGVLSPNPAIFNNRLHTYKGVVTEFEPTNYQSATEKTEVVLVPIADLAKLMLSGEINHALVCATLWRFLALQDQDLI